MPTSLNRSYRHLLWGSILEPELLSASLKSVGAIFVKTFRCKPLRYNSAKKMQFSDNKIIACNLSKLGQNLRMVDRGRRERRC